YRLRYFFVPSNGLSHRLRAPSGSDMPTLFITHPASLNHLNGTGHPERPDRIRAIESALEQEKFQALVREQAPLADLETAALCHPMDYIVEIKNAVPKEGLVQLDADT